MDSKQSVLIGRFRRAVALYRAVDPRRKDDEPIDPEVVITFSDPPHVDVHGRGSGNVCAVISERYDWSSCGKYRMVAAPGSVVGLGNTVEEAMSAMECQLMKLAQRTLDARDQCEKTDQAFAGTVRRAILDFRSEC